MNKRILVLGTFLALVTIASAVATYWHIASSLGDSTVSSALPTDSALTDGRGKESLPRLVENAQDALAKKDYPAAEQLADAWIRRGERLSEALLFAAQVAGEQEKIDDAIEYCDRVPKDRSPEAEVAGWVPCELLFRASRLTQSEQRLNAFLNAYPQRDDARRRLIYMMSLSGRRWESLPHLLFLVQNRQFSVETLVFLSDPEKIVDFSSELDAHRENQPNDPLPLLGLARIRIGKEDYATARALLDQTLSRYTVNSPQIGIGEAEVANGELLYKTDRTNDFKKWSDGLRGDALHHPEAWLYRALAASDEGDLKLSARYLYEAVRRSPSHRKCLFLLGKKLSELDRNDEAERIFELHQNLTAYVRACERLFGRAPELRLVLEAAKAASDCGKMWEAWGWNQVALSLDPGNTSAAEALKTIATVLPSMQNSLFDAQHHPGLLVDLNDIPLPTLPPDPLSSGQALAESSSARRDTSDARPLPSESPLSPVPSIRFDDVATATGLDFNYYSHPDPTSEGKRIYEFGGGGVAALDADRDGCVDIYLTQGCRWPPSDQDREFQNTLFRNRNAIRFEDVTNASKIGDPGFGQGVSVGDINSDGFPDIYVANIGGNRMFINQGDGTFVEDLNIRKMSPEKWTTSCVIVDVNDDGHPDIYDVNYLQGTDIYSRVCVWEGGKRRICGPATFAAEQDDLWLNTGTGHFQPATLQSGIELPNGNGLGIVAADFQGTGRIDLFIANDQQGNYLLVNKSSRESTGDSTGDSTGAASGQAGMPKFVDQAVFSGLAFDAEGLAQACMGVAVGDLTNNGLLDLFVTNFYRESNTLYQQRSAGDFSDVTRRTGLREPSLEVLGFGTQCVDVDLDGRLDIVATNGHLDDFTYLNQPYEMPPQAFWNAGNGRFMQWPTESIGDYFSGRYRGRSMARLDWNVDGAEDLVISHLDAPAALLSSPVPLQGTANDVALGPPAELGSKSIVIELVGGIGARDAIGAVVTLSIEDKTITRHLTAGDGYQASNEKILVFGLGSILEKGVRADCNLTTTWPGGGKQVFQGELELGGRYLWVEGRNPLRLR